MTAVEHLQAVLGFIRETDGIELDHDVLTVLDHIEDAVGDALALLADPSPSAAAQGADRTEGDA